MNTVCRAPFLLFVYPNKRASLSAMWHPIQCFCRRISKKKLLTRKIFVKFLCRPRTGAPKVSFYKWRSYQKEVMLMRWKMTMPMRTKENSAEKFIKIGRNFFWNRVLTREKCPFISEGWNIEKEDKKGKTIWDREKRQIKKYEKAAKRGWFLKQVKKKS